MPCFLFRIPISAYCNTLFLCSFFDFLLKLKYLYLKGMFGSPFDVITITCMAALLFFCKRLFEWHSERDCLSADGFPNGCNSQVWAVLKPGAGNSNMVSFVGGRGPSNFSQPPAFPGALAGT